MLLIIFVSDNNKDCVIYTKITEANHENCGVVKLLFIMKKGVDFIEGPFEIRFIVF